MGAEDTYIRSTTPLGIVNESGGRGWGQWGLAIFKITFVNYEEGYVHFVSKTKEPEPFEHRAPLTFPGGGRRSFFGMMPCVGDYAVVAFAPKESDGRAGARQPVIVSYFPPPTWLARDWLAGQDYDPSEGVMETGASRDDLRGFASRVRFKMRHLDEGEALISSRQGADLHLDESVYLSNRRANEIILRDQDQALVTRSLQQFHALAGARVYAGMVQRDARLLPTQMFSDGLAWNTSYTDIGEGLFEDGFLTPSYVFWPPQGSEEGYTGVTAFESQGGIKFQDELNPYEFLQWGLFVDSDGFQQGENLTDYSSYGGKVFYRVGDDTFEYRNSHHSGNPLSEHSLTEYRIELKHTSNGTLPVTEQTDGFDVDGYPDVNLEREANFVEMVLGTYVGNDPFTNIGKEKYGAPLVPVVFEGDTLVRDFVIGTDRPLNDQTAFSLIVTPPIDVRGRGDTRDSSFISITKEGRFLASFVGGRGSNAFEVFSQGGMRLGTEEGFNLTTTKQVSLVSQEGALVDNVGVNISSAGGAVKIFGGGKVATSEGEENSPDVLVEGRGLVQIKAKNKVKISAQTFDLSDTQNIQINTGGSFQVSSTGGYRVSAENGNETYTNGHSTNVSSNLPTSGASRKITIANLPTNPKAETYLSVFGNREETLIAGEHSTQVRVGRQVYSTQVGQSAIGAGLSSASFDSVTGVNVNTPQQMAVNVGVNTSFTSGGATSITATARASVSATGINLATPIVGGGVVSSTDLDPLSGRPLSTYNMGSLTVRLSP